VPSMREALMLALFLVVPAGWSCGAKQEWVIPRSGEAACMCTAVCACEGMAPSEESENERKRCWDACDCAPCPSGKP
jgi:hypothetical protein